MLEWRSAFVVCAEDLYSKIGNNFLDPTSAYQLIVIISMDTFVISWNQFFFLFRNERAQIRKFQELPEPIVFICQRFFFRASRILLCNNHKTRNQ